MSDYAYLRQNILELYDSLVSKKMFVNEAEKSEHLNPLNSILEKKRIDLCEKSLIIKLWTKFLMLVAVLRKIVHADRTGLLKVHLSALQIYLAIFEAAGHELLEMFAYIFKQC